MPRNIRVWIAAIVLASAGVSIRVGAGELAGRAYRLRSEVRTSYLVARPDNEGVAPSRECPQVISIKCPGRGSNPYAPCGAPDFKSGASASSATQARVVSTIYRYIRFRLVYVAYLLPMQISISLSSSR